MPIERYSEMPDAENPAEEQAPGEESEAPMEEQTASIPLSLLGGQSVSPGDVVRLEVTGVDEDSGEVSVKYATAPAKPAKQGLDSMAAEFD
jgi:hypothetical protein